jgi:UDP-2,3-diacylglucosamine hydrolase
LANFLGDGLRPASRTTAERFACGLSGLAYAARSMIMPEEAPAVDFGMIRGLVVSDLHLFSRRSDGNELWDRIDDVRGDAEILVLNGDTFDFRWSHFRDESKATAAALEWVERVTGDGRWKKVHYISGNHDCLSEFVKGLRELSSEQETLACHEFHLQLGRCLFLHGDCANRRMNLDDLKRYRASWSKDRPRGALSKALYDGVDALGVSKLFHKLYFPKERTVASLVHHLSLVFPEWRENLDHCYFGHTHQPFSGHEHGGVAFHNTGSGIRGMGFQPLHFKVNLDQR